MNQLIAIQRLLTPFFLFVICAFFISAGSAEGQPTLEWIRQFGTADDDSGNAIAADGMGSIYLAGTSGGQLGHVNGFVRKYDAAGNPLWDRLIATGRQNSYASSVALDGLGNVFVSGSAENDGYPYAAFLTKYDADGSLLWTREFGSDFGAEVWVSTDGTGNAYIGGTSPYDVSGDASLVKFDGDGNLLWTRQFGTSRGEAVHGVAADTLGNVYVSGNTTGSLGGPNNGEADAFLAKYDAAGNQLWVRQLGTDVKDSGTRVSLDGKGYVYVVGGTTGDLAAPNAGLYDFFVEKYNEVGDLIWIRQFGTNLSDDQAAISADGKGNIYTAGWTGTGSPYFGLTDAVISNYDDEGNPLWTHQLATSASDGLLGISADAVGNIYVSGLTRGDLGGPNAGLFDAFLAKFKVVPEPSTLLLAALAWIGCFVWRNRTQTDLSSE